MYVTDGTIVRGFDLRAGNVTFTVPFVAPGSYIITCKYNLVPMKDIFPKCFLWIPSNEPSMPFLVFGDSSNYSPIFTVLNKTT